MTVPTNGAPTPLDPAPLDPAPLDSARAVGDAVLYEGYLLYPYRASAEKNQERWQFGVLMPPSYAAAGTGEHAAAHTEVIAEADGAAVLHVRVRALQLQHRSVEAAGETGYHEVESLTVDGREWTEFDEAVEREVDAVVRLADALEGEQVVPFELPGDRQTERLDGGRIVRTCRPLTGQLRCAAERLPGPYGVVRISVRVVNTAEAELAGARRGQALRHALIAQHSVLALTGAEFISLLEPPEWAAQYAAGCTNEHTWPVLVGDTARRTVMLSSPIILYDYPQVAAESAGDFHDATEIDELLALRTAAMTDAEKAEARATDPRAAAIVDRADDLPPQVWERLHGAIRFLRPVAGNTAEAGTEATAQPSETSDPAQKPWWDPGVDASVSPETDTVNVEGQRVGKGSQVELRPGLRRADAQDMFLVGRRATVAAVFLDVDGASYLAVTLDEDPLAELEAAHGRFRYFAPDEVHPLGKGGP